MDHLTASQVHVSVLSLSRLTDFSVLSQFLYWSIPSHFRIGSDGSLFNLGNSVAKGWRQVSESPLVFYLSLCVSLCLCALLCQENCGKVKNYGRLLGNHTDYATLENKNLMYSGWKKKTFSPIYHIKSKHKKPRLCSR